MREVRARTKVRWWGDFVLVPQHLDVKTEFLYLFEEPCYLLTSMCSSHSGYIQQAENPKNNLCQASPKTPNGMLVLLPGVVSV